MLLLSIESSAKAVSVCLSSGVPEDPKNVRMLGEGFLQVAAQHTATILPLCEQLFAHAGILPHEIELYSLSHGPGSFTGLRNSMSVIKGMAYAASRPCVGISTLDAIAYGASSFVGLVCAVMDARCEQVYHVAYRQTATTRERLSPDEAISLTELERRLLAYQAEAAAPLPILLIGDGATLCYQQFSGTIPHLVLAPPHIRQQRASGVAMATWDYLAAGGTLTAASDLIPVYLRLSGAERQRLGAC